VVAEDPVMLFARTELARIALMSGKIWRIISFSTAYSQLDVNGEGGGGWVWEGWI